MPEATRAAATAYGFPVTGASALSESLVSAGLLLLLDFSERDALNAFAAAAADSPGCPLCLGLSALAHGPSLNRVPLESGKEGFGWAADDMAEAVHAARDAVGLARAVGIDRGDADPDWLLLQALSDRFVSGAVAGEARREDERAFQDRLLQLATHEEGTPWSAWMLVTAAQSLLLPVAWDYFVAAGGDGEPHVLREEAARADELLRQALAWAPGHPGALHLATHLWEIAGDTEGRATCEAFGDALASRGGYGLGHLAHMPSHAYVRVGRWADAVASNVQAHALDVAAGRACRTPYAPEHNLAMLVLAASMEGDVHTALEYAERKERVRAEAPGFPIASGVDCVTTRFVLVRFVRWDDVLALPPPGKGCRGGVSSHGGAAVARAVHHWARLLALLATERGARGGGPRTRSLPGAPPPLWVAEWDGLRAASDAVPPDLHTAPGQGKGIYSANNAELLEVLLAQARAALGLAGLEGGDPVEDMARAVRAEEAIGYREPAVVHQPPRQCHGAVLLHRGRPQEAREIFAEDLARFPDNPWSLSGLALALDALGDAGGAAEARARAERTWPGHLQPCPALLPL